jgi:hypothetical protein
MGHYQPLQTERPFGKLAMGFFFILLMLVVSPLVLALPERVFWGLVVAALGLLMIFFAFSMGSRPTELTPTTEDLVRMARRAAEAKQEFAAETYYCRAIYRWVSSGRLGAASGLFEEYFGRYQKVFAPRIQLELCRELCVNGKYRLAAKSLEKLIGEWSSRGHRNQRFLEQAYLRLARIYAEQLGQPGKAVDCYFTLLDKFPATAYRETALYQLQVLDLYYPPPEPRVSALR